ncbi:hypothetical protein BDZ45DRAFT_592291 [Acephala macrosclerotiorum]|nr:hypothetical protein BDZ45DRAFT_592291 [Acephala macrosclerotiorum]
MLLSFVILTAFNLIPLSQASVTCLTVGAAATATWTDSAGLICTWTGVVGSNFGSNEIAGSDCNGRCGVGCDGVAVGNAYTQDCFTHDICSYFEDASGGASDPNCGAAYVAAEDDFLLGWIDGCGQTNPDEGVMVPATGPVCV